MAKIRKLTGKAAQQYYDDFHAADVVPYINPINYFFAEVRAKILEHLGVELQYFDNRHRYAMNEMAIMDQMYILLYEGKVPDKIIARTPINTLRYKYLAHKYKLNFTRKPEWIIVSPPDAAKMECVWHEDIAEYNNR